MLRLFAIIIASFIFHGKIYGYCPEVEGLAPIGLQVKSTDSGLRIDRFLHADAWVTAPYKLTLENASYLHHPSWYGASKKGGLSINDHNRSLMQVDLWPPHLDRNPRYLSLYGKPVWEYFRYYQQGFNGHPTDEPVYLNIAEPAINPSLPNGVEIACHPVVTVKIHRRHDDECRQTNPLGNQIACPPLQVEWAGPADINLDGQIDSRDLSSFLQAFNSGEADFDEDSQTTHLDLIRFLNRWSSGRACQGGAWQGWSDAGSDQPSSSNSSRSSAGGISD